MKLKKIIDHIIDDKTLEVKEISIEVDEAPNTDLICNICGEKITSICMMSPDWSATKQFESALIPLRKHLKAEHGMEPPTP